MRKGRERREEREGDREREREGERKVSDSRGIDSRASASSSIHHGDA